MPKHEAGTLWATAQCVSFYTQIIVTEWRKKNNRKYRQRNTEKEKENRSQNVTVIVCLFEILNGKMENISKSLCIVRIMHCVVHC